MSGLQISGVKGVGSYVLDVSRRNAKRIGTENPFPAKPRLHITAEPRRIHSEEPRLVLNAEPPFVLPIGLHRARGHTQSRVSSRVATAPHACGAPASIHRTVSAQIARKGTLSRHLRSHGSSEYRSLGPHQKRSPGYSLSHSNIASRNPRTHGIFRSLLSLPSQYMRNLRYMHTQPAAENTLSFPSVPLLLLIGEPRLL